MLPKGKGSLQDDGKKKETTQDAGKEKSGPRSGRKDGTSEGVNLTVTTAGKEATFCGIARVMICVVSGGRKS